MEAAARNGEAIAASDRDASDEDIAAAVESEFGDTSVLTVSVSGDTVTVTQTNGGVSASGSVEFVDGDAVITAATVGSGSSSSTTSTTAAPTTTTVASVSYSVGDTGPAGGVIFYVASTPFACGPTLAATCTYLEAAPADLAPTVWCSDTSNDIGATADAIGAGMKNTTDAEVTCTSGAIQQAANYSSNGYTDWYLPSRLEMVELYNASQTTPAIGGLPGAGGFGDPYWTSTEWPGGLSWHADSAARSMYTSFLGGESYPEPKSSSYPLRPVRAF